MNRVAAVVAGIAAAGALAAGPAAASDVALSFANAKPVKLIGAATPDRQYDSDTIVWLPCRRGATPLMTAWRGARAPIAMVYSHVLNSSRQLALAVRKPLAGATFRAQVLCASGPVRAKARDSAGGAGTISCAKGQVAIGVPVDGGPYWSAAVASRPDGTRGWRNEEPSRSARAKVICVSAKAFRGAQIVKRTATFPVGRSTATVAATCPAGKRPISWGFAAGTLEQNVWRSVESTATMAAPFIAASTPRGRAGWALTFATPDGTGAKTTTSLELYLTCARPA